MAEIKLEPIVLYEGETFACEDGEALVFVDDHTHSDILRYVVSDIGLDCAKRLLDKLEL